MQSLLKQFQPILRLQDESVYTGADLQVSAQWEGPRLRLQLTNRGNQTYQIKEVALFAGEIPFSEDTDFYGEGYHMLTQHRGTLAHPEAIGSYDIEHVFFHFPENGFRKPEYWIAYNLMMLFPKNQDCTLLAFSSCERFLGEFRFCKTYLEIVMDTEDLPLDPGETWTLEEFYCESGPDKNRLLQNLADAINVNHPRMIYPEIPTGWCSYYCLRPMTGQGLVENGYAMAEKIPELRKIQIDGGYEAYDGDWLTPHPRLGSDVKTICDNIRKTGMEAAGYISPFLGETGSQLLAQHPEWFVHDAEGNPCNEYGRPKKPNWFMLDGSHPGACEYLGYITKVMYEEWGIRYFKLDFLSYGALPGGVRHNPKMSRVESFRSAIKAIIRAAGEDSFILGCNAPMWAMLGLCHGMRVTNDIARDWRHVSTNATELFYRNWQNNTLWVNDPDVIVLEPLDLSSRRPDGTWADRRCSLTDAEFEFHKAFIVACGGMILSGDLMTTISEKSIQCLKKLLPCTGVAAQFPDNQFRDGWVYLEDRILLCLFQWEDKSGDLTVSLPEGRYQLSDFWSDADLGEAQGSLTVSMEPHGGRVLCLKKI